jgi:hypothetical protein
LAGEQSSELLRQAYCDDEDADGAHHYNLGTLICLPKKTAGHNEDLGDFYSPDGTRPLSLVNTDNRLVASAARIRWEGILSSWVSRNQQGFLHGRSLLENLISLDSAAMQTALSGPEGAIILFDIKAAFPSISTEYLLQALQHIGLPVNAIR